MTQIDLIEYDERFAWFPVKTEDCGWVWLQYVEVVIDERPEYYHGMLPETMYWILGGYEYYMDLIKSIEKIESSESNNSRG